MAVALLARGAAVLKPAAATRATMDWEYFIVGILSGNVEQCKNVKFWNDSG